MAMGFVVEPVNQDKSYHWDIVDLVGNRMFCLRGDPGEHVIYDERKGVKRYEEGQRLEFKTVDAAMAWICSTLMYSIPQQDLDDMATYELLRKRFG